MSISQTTFLSAHLSPLLFSHTSPSSLSLSSHILSASDTRSKDFSFFAIKTHSHVSVFVTLAPYFCDRFLQRILFFDRLSSYGRDQVLHGALFLCFWAILTFISAIVSFFRFIYRDLTSSFQGANISYKKFNLSFYEGLAHESEKCIGRWMMRFYGVFSVTRQQLVIDLCLICFWRERNWF